MADNEKEMNRKKDDKEKHAKRSPHKDSKKHKHRHHRHKSTSKNRKQKRKKGGCGLCRARKTTRGKKRENASGPEPVVQDNDRKLSGMPPAKAAAVGEETLQPPQAAPLESSNMDVASSELKKSAAKSDAEAKETPAPASKADVVQAPQGDTAAKSEKKQDKIHRKKKHKKHRAKLPQETDGTAGAVAKNAAAGTNAVITSGQQPPISASGDAKGSRLTEEKIPPPLPASAPAPKEESKGGAVQSAITSSSQVARISDADTLVHKLENLEKVFAVSDGQEAQNLAAVSASQISTDGREAGDVILVDGGLRLRRHDVDDPVERRRKAVDRVPRAVRKRSESTFDDNEEDITLAVRTCSGENKKFSQVKKVRDFVKSVSKEGLNGIRRRFIGCQYYLPRAATRVSFDQNPTRVRYRAADVICIDQTRVILKCNPDGSDFIHANRIPIGDKENQIIVTQLPLENTVSHFWEMVWQEKAEAVLLILTEEEWKAHAERLQLVPSQLQCLHFGNMTITMASQVSVTRNWTVYEIGLTKHGKSRRIAWHHYSGWEQNKGGADIQTIWKIYSSLRKLRRPLICMSMAGVGRAGTYAALEWAHAMHHDRYRRTMNIEECVKRVREYRMHSVQSLSQFEYIYMLMLRHIFLVQKIRDDYLSNPTLQRDLGKCIEVEKQYFQENTKEGDDEAEMTLRCF